MDWRGAVIGGDMGLATWELTGLLPPNSPPTLPPITASPPPRTLPPLPLLPPLGGASKGLPGFLGTMAVLGHITRAAFEAIRG